MLQRQIDVLADFLAVRHRSQRPIIDRRRIQVEQSDPLEATDAVQLSQQFRQGPAFAAVESVERSPIDKRGDRGFQVR